MELDCAMNDLVWKDNPGVFESLKNVKELVELISDSIDEDVEELDFEE